MAKMAVGICKPAPHLSSLDPGVGKTTAVLHFLRVLLASPQHFDVGALICIPRLAEIESIVGEAGLSDDHYAVYSRDDNMNALGRGEGEHRNARGLFITHAMLESRVVRAGSFEAVYDFRYDGTTRAVRVWDEALLPGRPITVTRMQIARLFPALSYCRFPGLAGDLERLSAQLRNEQDGTQIELPDLAAKHDVDIDKVRSALRWRSDDQAIAEALWPLFGRIVTVRRDGAIETDGAGAATRGHTVLDYQNTLPADLWPVLILDASGRVRDTYRLWESERRGGLVRLAEGLKSYEGHTVHVWDAGGSKTAWKRDAAKLIGGIVKAVKERLDEEWLVVVHKANTIDTDIEARLRKRLPPKARVHFVTWGMHNASNRWASVPNVILAGMLSLPRSAVEAIGRCAADFPSSAGKLDKASIDAVELGEHRDRVLQAVCRGAVRSCVDGRCRPGTHTDIIASKRSGIAEAIPDVLPGAKVVPWIPHRKPLRGRPAEALKIIAGIAGDRIAAVEVMVAMGMRSAHVARMRQSEGFQQALAEAGFHETREGRGKGGAVWFVRR
jgi:hypothetical protein